MLKLQTKLLAPLILLIALSLLLMGGTAYFYLLKNSKAAIIDEAKSLTETIVPLINTQFDSAKSNLLLFAKSNQIKQYLQSDDTRYDFLQPGLIRQLSEYQRAYPSYYEIRLLLPSGEEDTRIVNRKMANKALNEKNSVVFSALAKQVESQPLQLISRNPDNQEMAVYTAMALRIADPFNPTKDDDIQPKLRGYMVITMSLDFIQTLIDKVHIGTSGFLLLATDQGDIIFQPAHVKLAPGVMQEIVSTIKNAGNALVENEHYFIQAHPLSANLDMISVIPTSEFDTAARELGLWLLCLILSMIAVISWLTIFHLRSCVLNPIYKLRDIVNHIGGGYLEHYSPVPSSTLEFSQLYDSVEAMRSNLENSYKNITRLAYYDELTGLPNRVTLRKQLDAMIQSGLRTELSFAVVFIDLDNFKDVNDNYGHDVGDQLLIEAGKRIQKNLRINDYVARQHDDASDNQRALLARQGGDEFILLISQFKSPEAVNKSVGRVLHALTQPFDLAQADVYVGASIGIAIYPQDGTSAEELLKNADLAMYDAKENGKNSLSFYTKEMNVIAFQHHQLESNLRNALDNNEFSLEFQPRIATASGRLDGFEALIRWHNPTLGNVPPMQFIPVAEESMLICEIGFWVLTRACEQIKHWTSLGYTDICVSVNLSPVQIYRGETLNMIKAALAYHNILAKNLEIEITESSLLDDEKKAIQFLCDVRALGVRVALDDFGTGYSSLSYLRTLPIDILKIDRSFILDLAHNEDTRMVFEAIIGLAKKLNLKTVAEGVETLEQLQQVQQVCCDFVQGYYYSKPLCIEFTQRFLTEYCLLPSQVQACSPSPYEVEASRQPDGC